MIYISTDSGHYPFETDPVLRPPLIKSNSKDPLLNAYANAVYYDSGELADYIARIRARDPDAVILAFGVVALVSLLPLPWRHIARALNL